MALLPFSLSYRDIDLMAHQKGIIVTYESVRYWCIKFGKLFAQKLRKKATYGDRYHLDEVFCRIMESGFICSEQSIKFKSYRKPCKEIFPETIHIHDKGANNRAENFHQATRLRECKMRRFKLFKQAQVFLSCFARIYDHFRGDRHLCLAKTFRILMNRQFEEWKLITQVVSKI